MSQKLITTLVILLLAPGLAFAQGTTNVKGFFDTADVVVKAGDATNNALRVNIVAGGGAGGGVAQLQVRNSGDTAWVNVGVGIESATVLKVPVRIHDASGNIVAVLNAAPVGTEYALVVRNVPSGTQTIAGTITANQGGTWTVQPGNTANTTAWLVTGAGGTFPVTGTVTSNQGGAPWTIRVQDGVGATLATVTAGNALKVDGSAVTQPISAASLPLPAGAATEVTLAKLPLGQASATAGQSGTLVQGAVTTGPPTYTTGQTDPLSLTTAGALRVDGSGVTQPVSGTVTANQGTAAAVGGAWPAKVTDGTNVAAVKAASTAAVAADPSVVAAISPNTPLPAGTNVLGALSANQSVNLNQYGGTATTLGAKASASSVPVVPATDWVWQDTVGTTAALNALNATATVALAGRNSVGMFLATGTLIGTIIPEVSYDGGTTWVATIFIDPTSGGFSTSTSVVFAAANAATSLSIQAGGGVTNARVRVSAFTSGTANATLRATMQEENIIVVQGKPFTALGWYRVSGRTATYAGLAASAPLIQIRNGTAGVLMIVLRVRVAVMTTVAATTAGGNQREIIVGRSWTVSDTGTALTLTGNNNKLRTSMATSIADIKHGAPLTAGTRTLDANAMGQVIFWEPLNITGSATGEGGVATGAAGSGLGAKPYALLDATTGEEQPVVLAQNEGLLIRLGPDAQPVGATNQTYFDIYWAEATAF